MLEYLVRAGTDFLQPAAGNLIDGEPVSESCAEPWTYWTTPKVWVLNTLGMGQSYFSEWMAIKLNVSDWV